MKVKIRLDVREEFKLKLHNKLNILKNIGQRVRFLAFEVKDNHTY